MGLNSSTHWCVLGKHEKCAHAKGGPAYGGLRMTTGEWFRCACRCHQTIIKRRSVPVAAAAKD